MTAFLILLISSIVHLFRFGFPKSVVFDEVFYGNFMTYYWQGTYFFDQHPQFFKILIAFVGQLFGLSNLNANWDSIGNQLPTELILVRIVSIISGIVLPLVIYYICRRFDISKTASTVGALLVTFENSLIVQSRYILPDVVMLLFGFLAILFYLEYTRRMMDSNKAFFLAISTISAGIALSIKWTGLTFLFMIILLESYRYYYNSNSLKEYFRYIPIFIGKYLLICGFIYVSLFAIHFSILPLSGKGDVFMTNDFQKTLVGNTESGNQTIEISFWQKFAELNRVMYQTNAGMTATHPNSSKWYTWPIMMRSVFYWQGNSGTGTETNAYIYLLGNPFIYWLGSLTMIFTILYIIIKLILHKNISRDPNTSKLLLFIAVGYLANWLPFALIGRVMFLYHYEVALIFSIIAITYWISSLQPKNKKVVSIVLVFFTLISFIYWSPLTYGLPLDNDQLQQRMWLSGWR